LLLEQSFVWQRLLLTQMTPIKLRWPEDFNEFHTPCRPDWSQSVSVNARFVVASHTISQQLTSWPKAKTLGWALIPVRQNITKVQPATHCQACFSNRAQDQSIRLKSAKRVQARTFRQRRSEVDALSAVFADHFCQIGQSLGDLYSSKASLL
tara:strand:+ start:490 stop:945 length:456 start_codon:yes stop_codon:yes gene_type:complete